jgi:SAM-dependent methyltransferase
MIDFGKTTRDYAKYRVPFTPGLFDRLRDHGIGAAAQRILDVGAGTGLLGAALANNGCLVTSIDLSHDLLRTSTVDGTCLLARAESLPFADQTFDVVTAAQCWHWFDRHAAPREILRVLRPTGSVAVIYQTYIPLPGSIAERTEQLILRHRPGWRHANSTGINGQVLRDLQINGFCRIESFSFDVCIPFSRENWRGYIRATSAVGASMMPAQLAQFDAEHESQLRDAPEPLHIPHRVFAAIARKASDSLSRYSGRGRG